ncbi:MAG: hypothetical protein AAF950_12525 [Pseudomonadota bacterium]
MHTDYEYRASSKQGASLFGAAVVIFLSLFGLAYGAPWWIWIIWLPASVSVLFLLLTNRKYGMGIKNDVLLIGVEPVRARIPLSDIERLEIQEWSDSTDIKLVLKDGRSIKLLPQDTPPRRALVAQFEQRGILAAVK